MFSTIKICLIIFFPCFKPLSPTSTHNPTNIRSNLQLHLGHWHTIKIQKVFRKVTLTVNNVETLSIISIGKFMHLTTSPSFEVFLSGGPEMDKLPVRAPSNLGSYVGCVRHVRICFQFL